MRPGSGATLRATPPFTASQIDDFNVILTSVFGEPIVPVRQPEREVAMFEEVIAAVDNREVSALNWASGDRRCVRASGRGHRARITGRQ